MEKNLVVIGQTEVSFPIKNNIEKHFKSPQIKQLDYDSKRNFVKVLVFKSYTSCNQKFEKENLILIVNELVRDFENDYRGLTLNEIENVFRNGIRKKYGEYYGLSLQTFQLWIEKYMEIEREDTVRPLLIKKHVEVKTPDNEKLDILKKGFERIYKSYLETGIVEEDDTYVYEVLEESNLIKQDKRVMELCFKRAQEFSRTLNYTRSTYNDERKENMTKFKERCLLDRKMKTIKMTRKYYLEWYLQLFKESGKETNVLTNRFKLKIK